MVDVGNGLEIIWTPAVDTNEVLGIPALEAASLKPGAWVFPATEQADRILENPEHPPEYQDFIIWFPTHPQIAPIYLSLNLRYAPGVVSGTGEDLWGCGLIMPAVAWVHLFLRQWSMCLGAGLTAGLILSGVRFGGRFRGFRNLPISSLFAFLRRHRKERLQR